MAACETALNLYVEIDSLGKRREGLSPWSGRDRPGANGLRRGGGGNRTHGCGFCRAEPYHLATPPDEGQTELSEVWCCVNA